MRFKERPVLDSLTSSTHFVGPAIYGTLLGQPHVTGRTWAVLAAFFVWGVASHAFGAVQDIEADRAAGIGSVATALGARTVVRASTLGYLVSGAVLLLGTWPAPLASVLPLPYAILTGRYWRTTDATATETNRGWRRFLALNYATGFLVTQLLIVTHLALN
ncbi:prenyltransferase [Actinomycetota bacterium]